MDRNNTSQRVQQPWGVALRKESVDRNDAVQIVVVIMHASLSARRAWIEILTSIIVKQVNTGRSPQGERG